LITRNVRPRVALAIPALLITLPLTAGSRSDAHATGAAE
jgi:hypothetical protein